MKCTEAKSLFSAYLDGAVTGRQMSAISDHIRQCRDCTHDYALLRRTQQLVAAVGRKKAPPDLALKIRVAVSQEAALSRRRRWEGFVVRAENALNSFMVPAISGALTAVLVFGLLIGLIFSVPTQLMASNEDVPTMLYTPPELASAPFGLSVNSGSSDLIVVEAYVDANGRVQDFRVLSGPQDAADSPQLKNMLIFTTFHPATAFGRPTAGRTLLSFSKINVKG